MTKDEQLDSDDWRAYKQERQQRRYDNRKSGVEILQQHAVQFQTKDQIHLIVKHAGKTIDFWPSTGKWIDRAAVNHHRRGVFQLLDYLGVPHR